MWSALARKRISYRTARMVESEAVDLSVKCYFILTVSASSESAWPELVIRFIHEGVNTVSDSVETQRR